MWRIQDPRPVVLTRAAPTELEFKLPAFFVGYFGLKEGTEFQLAGKRTKHRIIITLSSRRQEKKKSKPKRNKTGEKAVFKAKEKAVKPQTPEGRIAEVSGVGGRS